MGVRLKTPNDVKLYILCLMEYIGYPLDYATINDMVLQDEFVTNFDFIDNFNDLLEKKIIKRMGADGDEKYYITEEGRFISDTLKSDIAGYIRERGMKSAMRLVSFKQSGTEVKAGKRPREDGKFDVICRILKNKEEILCVTLLVDTEFQCERMLENFHENPERLYRVVLAALTNDIAPVF